MEEKRDMMTECNTCTNAAEVPNNCHIRCDKPDPDMTGDKYGMSQGWFIYPMLFDPVWKTKFCNNYEKK